MDHLREFTDSGKLIILPYRSMDAIEYLAKVLIERPADWIFIDGDHDPTTVAMEIDRARYMRIPLISGHDRMEVHEALPNGVLDGPGEIWYYHDQVCGNGRDT